MSREAAFSALFAAVSSAYPWGLASRRMKIWSEVPAALRPAFFRGEVLNRDTPTRVPEDIGVPVGLFGIEPFDEQ